MRVASPAHRKKIVRLWRLCELLRGTRRGYTALELVDKLAVSKATAYRDLGDLQEAGVPVHSSSMTGTTRYRLTGDGLPPLRVSSSQFAALALARIYMRPLNGTTLVEGLDALLDEGARRLGTSPDSAPATVANEPKSTGKSGVMATLERGISEARRVEIEYRGTSDDTSRRREFEPRRLILHGGFAYVIGWDVGAAALRTFKIARMERAKLLAESQGTRSLDIDSEMERSIGIWTGDLVEVRVFLHADVERFVHEWPLCDWQRVDPVDSGVVVSAEVAGTMDVFRWVLRWGRNAEVLSPQALRIKVRDETQAMAGRYADAEKGFSDS